MFATLFICSATLVLSCSALSFEGTYHREPPGSFGSTVTCKMPTSTVVTCNATTQTKSVFTFNATLYGTDPVGNVGGIGVGQLFQSGVPNGFDTVGLIGDPRRFSVVYGPQDDFAGKVYVLSRKFCDGDHAKVTSVGGLRDKSSQT